MVKDGIDVWREHALVLVVDLHGRIGPPQEGLRHVRTVVEHTFYFYIRTTGAQREAGHALLMEHLLHLAHPHRHGAVCVLLKTRVSRHIGRRAVMLGPVELYAAADPRPRQTYQGGLDDVVVIHEVALTYLVIGHLYAPTKLRHDHHLDILILQEHHIPLMRRRLIGHRLYDRIRIYHTA